MAFLGETASLIAVLKLNDQFSGPLKNGTRALSQFDAKLTHTASRGYKAGQQIGTGILNGAKIAAVGLTSLAGLLLLSAKEGQAAANVQKIYAQAIADSGKVSQAQVGILNAQQAALLQLGGVDDELIKTEQTRLIQMGLTGDAVARLTPLILDVAKATGKDLLTVTVAVGKAVNGNVTALQRLGIVLPKATKAAKSAQLVALEHAKAQLLVRENQDKASGALTKSEKAYYAQKKASLDAAIGQQKLVDAQKAGKKSTDQLTVVTDALNKRFGGTTAALSGSLDVKLAVLREKMANVREEAGQKLLPVMTRIVDVVGSKLVPAFGKLIDAILPQAITGLNKLAGFLESGGATEGVNRILKTASQLAPIIQKSAEITGRVITTAVDLFKSLPPEIQSLAVAGLAINKLTGGLVTNIAGGLISAVISSFKGLMNVNAGVVNVNGPVGGSGSLGSAAGGAGLLGTIGAVAVPVTILAIADSVITQWANADLHSKGFTGDFKPQGAGFLPFGIDTSIQNLATALDVFNQNERRKAAAAAGGTQGLPFGGHDISTTAGTTGGGTQGLPFGGHVPENIKALDANTAALKAVPYRLTGVLAQSESDIIAGIRKRSAARYGGTGLGKSAVDATFVRDLLRINTRILHSSNTGAQRLAALQKLQADFKAHGDTKLAARMGGEIRSLKATLQRKKLSVVVHNTVQSTTYMNGRIFEAATNRYRTVLGSPGVVADYSP